jgi:hypothetical protein
MITQKQTITNSTLPWSVNKRYKVNDVVTQGGKVYQNKTGANSEPSLLTDWTFIGGSTSTPTLQEVTDEGATTTNTIEIDIDEGDAIILKSGGNNVGLISTTNGGVDFITNDVLGESSTQYRNGNIEVEKNSGSPKTYQLPTNEDGTFDLIAIVVNANKTAENDGNYSVVANATFTDPTPVEGKGYEVTVINGTATIGGVGYTVGQKVFRHFHSGSWRTFVYFDDLENGCIPLSGTTTGNPLTGLIEITADNGDEIVGFLFDNTFLGTKQKVGAWKSIDQDNTGLGIQSDSGKIGGFVKTPFGISFIAQKEDSSGSEYFQFSNASDGIIFNPSTGIDGNLDYTSNYGDNSFVQKIYVDNQFGKLISLTETEILAIASPEVGRLYYNTTQNHVVYYDGTSWRTFVLQNANSLSKIVIKDTVSSAPVTSSTLNTLAKTYEIQGNTFDGNDAFNLEINAQKSSTLGTATIRVYVNTVNNFATATLYSTTTSAAASVRDIPTSRSRSNFKGTNLIVVEPASGLLNDLNQGFNAPRVALPLNPANNFFVFVAIQNANAGDSTTIESVHLTN